MRSRWAPRRTGCTSCATASTTTCSRRAGAGRPAADGRLRRRLSPEKDPRTFVEAAALVHARAPAVRFTWSATGRCAPSSRRWQRERRLRRRVAFCGVRDDMPATYAALDVLALTSLHEGTPLAVLEAMACGVPGRRDERRRRAGARVRRRERRARRARRPAAVAPRCSRCSMTRAGDHAVRRRPRARRRALRAARAGRADGRAAARRRRRAHGCAARHVAMHVVDGARPPRQPCRLARGRAAHVRLGDARQVGERHAAVASRSAATQSDGMRSAYLRRYASCAVNMMQLSAARPVSTSRSMRISSSRNSSGVPKNAEWRGFSIDRSRGAGASSSASVRGAPPSARQCSTTAWKSESHRPKLSLQ